MKKQTYLFGTSVTARTEIPKETNPFGASVTKLIAGWNEHKPKNWITEPTPDWTYVKPNVRLLKDIKTFAKKVKEDNWDTLATRFSIALVRWLANGSYSDLSYDWAINQVLNSQKLYHYYKLSEEIANVLVSNKYRIGMKLVILGYDNTITEVSNVFGTMITYKNDENNETTVCSEQELEDYFSRGWIVLKGNEEIPLGHALYHRLKEEQTKGDGESPGG